MLQIDLNCLFESLIIKLNFKMKFTCYNIIYEASWPPILNLQNQATDQRKKEKKKLNIRFTMNFVMGLYKDS